MICVSGKYAMIAYSGCEGMLQKKSHAPSRIHNTPDNSCKRAATTFEKRTNMLVLIQNLAKTRSDHSIKQKGSRLTIHTPNSPIKKNYETFLKKIYEKYDFVILNQVLLFQLPLNHRTPPKKTPLNYQKNHQTFPSPRYQVHHYLRFPDVSRPLHLHKVHHWANPQLPPWTSPWPEAGDVPARCAPWRRGHWA